MNNEAEIFIDFIYDAKTVDVTNTKYQVIFERSNFDPSKITAKQFLWCAAEIANSLPTTKGVKFLEATVNIASYLLNKKE
jgi:hypothetical protein